MGQSQWLPAERKEDGLSIDQFRQEQDEKKKRRLSLAGRPSIGDALVVGKARLQGGPSTQHWQLALQVRLFGGGHRRQCNGSLTNAYPTLTKGAKYAQSPPTPR